MTQVSHTHEQYVTQVTHTRACTHARTRTHTHTCVQPHARTHSCFVKSIPIKTLPLSLSLSRSLSLASALSRARTRALSLSRALSLFLAGARRVCVRARVPVRACVRACVCAYMRACGRIYARNNAQVHPKNYYIIQSPEACVYILYKRSSYLRISIYAYNHQKHSKNTRHSNKVSYATDLGVRVY